MSRNIPDERLELMHLKLSLAIRNQTKTKKIENIVIPGGVVISASDLTCLLDELRLRRGTKRRARNSQYRMGDLSKALIEMTVGEIIIWKKSVTNGSLNSARKTARKCLNQPTAAWSSRTLPDGSLEIKRRYNGALPKRMSHNPAIDTLANMKVGEFVVLQMKDGKIETTIKTRARMLMQDLQANWRYVTLQSGELRCERIS